METRLSSATKHVIIGHEHPTVLIGERINPTGKKKMAEALRAGDMEIVCQEAVAQVAAGADIIDINVNATSIDELTMLPQVVRSVMQIVDAPLCLDSPNPKALAAALKIYRGKPLINSVTGETRSLEQVLPLVKEYGAAVICLPQDDNGVPTDVEPRLAIAQRIIERAEVLGIPREDLIIDCLTFAVGADGRSGLVTLETIRRVRAKLGVNVTLGASNISFGLPDRGLLNHAYVAMAIASGVTCLIVDVARVRPMVLAADVLFNRDGYAQRYIQAYRQRQSA